MTDRDWIEVLVSAVDRATKAERARCVAACEREAEHCADRAKEYAGTPQANGWLLRRAAAGAIADSIRESDGGEGR